MSAAKKTQAQSVDTTSMTLSSGSKVDNPLMTHIRGEFVPYVQSAPRQTGKTTFFFSSYLQNTSGAAQGWTGPMVATLLCELGYLHIACDGKVYDAGTSGDKIPDPEFLKVNQARYEAVKELPTRAEFWQLIRTLRDQAKTQVAK